MKQTIKDICDYFVNMATNVKPVVTDEFGNVAMPDFYRLAKQKQTILKNEYRPYAGPIYQKEVI